MSERIPIHAFDMSCIMHQSPGLWARPDDQSVRYKDLRYWTELTRILERGKIDSLFIADVIGVYDTYQGSRDASVRRGMQIPVHDPVIPVSAMAAVTEKLGFGITVSATYYEGALAFYAGVTGVDLSQLDSHPPLQYVDTDSARFALDIFSRADPNRDWTPNEVARFVGVGAMGPVIVGSPATVADELERWVDEADITGFNLAYAVTPGTFVDFIDLVVPELRRRGRYWHDYDEGTTLREKIYGPGQKRVRDDHPAAVYRRAMEDRAATRDDAAVQPAGR